MAEEGLTNMDEAIKVTYSPETGNWILMQDYKFTFKTKQIVILAGYSFYASIPRNVWPWISPDDLALTPVLIHDYLYEAKGFLILEDAVLTYTREEADNLFLEKMVLAKVSFIKRNLAYLAVHYLGWIYWNR